MSVHEIITDRVVARIEEAIKTGERFRWCKPFTGGVKQAISYMSGLPYRGVNRLLLEPGCYITYKNLMDYKKTQPESANIYVKSGSHKYPVFYYGVSEEKDEVTGQVVLDENGDPIQHKFLKYYSVFNIEDIAGVKAKYAKAVKTPKVTTALTKKIDKFISEYVKSEGLEIDVVEDGGNAFFDMKNRRIRIPAKDEFKSSYMYYSTIFHELIHSTSIGLNRNVRNSFGSEAYSREELIAELGASFLLSEFGIPDDDNDSANNVEYLAGWATKLKESTTEIAKAAAQAEKAMQYFLEKAGAVEEPSKSA